MSELVTLITCTGWRPAAWALCQKFIARQTFKGPIQWVVVYDEPGIEPQSSPDILKCKNIKQEFHPSVKDWRPGINTQHFNMDEALKHVKGDYIFVVEDDDWYAPNYLETFMYLLQRFDIVGQADSKYYNIKERSWRKWGNNKHTSLCETGLKRSKLDLLDRAVNSGDLFFDMQLWNIVHGEKHSNLIFQHIGLVVGMKGLPGRVGIGGGHHQTDGFTRDPRFDVLKEWIGLEDTQEYVKIAQANFKGS